jgi:hypothetical protein
MFWIGVNSQREVRETDVCVQGRVERRIEGFRLSPERRFCGDAEDVGEVSAGVQAPSR